MPEKSRTKDDDEDDYERKRSLGSQLELVAEEGVPSIRATRLRAVT